MEAVESDLESHSSENLLFMIIFNHINIIVYLDSKY